MREIGAAKKYDARPCMEASQAHVAAAEWDLDGFRIMYRWCY